MNKPTCKASPGTTNLAFLTLCSKPVFQGHYVGLNRSLQPANATPRTLQSKLCSPNPDWGLIAHKGLSGKDMDLGLEDFRAGVSETTFEAKDLSVSCICTVQ